MKDTSNSGFLKTVFFLSWRFEKLWFQFILNRNQVAMTWNPHLWHGFKLSLYQVFHSRPYNIVQLKEKLHRFLHRGKPQETETYTFSSPEVTLLLVSTKNRDLSGHIHHRTSTIHGLPVTLRILRVKSDKSDWFWSQSIVYKAIQNQNLTGLIQRSWFLVLTKRSIASGDENETYNKHFTKNGVYLGVRTCELFLCFVAIVRVRAIMLTSLFSLCYVTGEFHRFLHRGRAEKSTWL